MGLGDLGHDRDVGGAGLGSSGLVGTGWSWGSLGTAREGLGLGDPWGQQGCFWGTWGTEGWGTFGQSGDGFGVGIFGYSGDGFGGSLGTEGWVWGWGSLGRVGMGDLWAQ